MYPSLADTMKTVLREKSISLMTIKKLESPYTSNWYKEIRKTSNFTLAINNKISWGNSNKASEKPL